MRVSKSALTSLAITPRSVWTKGLPLSLNPGECHQVGDQGLHPGRRIEHSLEVISTLLIERFTGFCFEPVTEGENLPQRLLEVVRSDLREILQLAVAALQLGGVDS